MRPATASTWAPPRAGPTGAPTREPARETAAHRQQLVRRDLPNVGRRITGGDRAHRARIQAPSRIAASTSSVSWAAGPHISVSRHGSRAAPPPTAGCRGREAPGGRLTGVKHSTGVVVDDRCPTGVDLRGKLGRRTRRAAPAKPAHRHDHSAAPGAAPSTKQPRNSASSRSRPCSCVASAASSSSGNGVRFTGTSAGSWRRI